MSFEKIIFEKKEGIGFITLNDPDNRNAVSGSIVPELARCFDECTDDPEVRAVVLRGAGKFFSAGGNIQSMQERIDKGITDFRPPSRNLAAVAVKIRNIRKPVIASIQGAAAGAGLSLAMACDFRIMAEDAKCVFAFVNLGLIPDGGALFSLAKAVGTPRATELLMTAKMFTGQEAFEWGLATKAVPADELEEATMKLVNKLAKGPTTAYGLIKTMLNRVEMGGLELQLDNEAEYQSICAATDDFKEGVRSFFEKRRPVFQGR